MSARSNERLERPAGKAERRKDGELAGGRSAASRWADIKPRKVLLRDRMTRG